MLFSDVQIFSFVGLAGDNANQGNGAKKKTACNKNSRIDRDGSQGVLEVISKNHDKKIKRLKGSTKSYKSRVICPEIGR